MDVMQSDMMIITTFKFEKEKTTANSGHARQPGGSTPSSIHAQDILQRLTLTKTATPNYGR